MSPGRRIGAALAVVAALALGQRAEAAGIRMVVRADAGRRVARVGATVTVTIQIQDARDVGSVPFTLLYDPDILEPLPSAAREGPFLKRDRAATTFLVSTGSAPGAASGVIVGLSRLESDRGARGRGVLCRLIFRARAPGVSTLAFSRAAILDPRALPLAGDFKGGTVTVKGSR